MSSESKIELVFAIVGTVLAIVMGAIFIPIIRKAMNEEPPRREPPPEP